MRPCLPGLFPPSLLLPQKAHQGDFANQEIGSRVDVGDSRNVGIIFGKAGAFKEDNHVCQNLLHNEGLSADDVYPKSSTFPDAISVTA